MARSVTQRLVSHRLRGFSATESSLSALDAALAAGVRFVEIDTRVTADREILVFHDARLDPLTRESGRVADHRSRSGGRPVFAADGGERIATLAEFLERLADSNDSVEVLIDVKDLGVEREHWKIIESSGLAARVWVMSWWPEVLLRMHEIAPQLRLVLSYIPLDRAPWWVQTVRLFGSGGLVRWMGRLRGDSRGARYMQDSIFRHQPLRPIDPSDGNARGRYPVYFARGLPAGALGRVLAASAGAIGTWPRVIDRDLVRAAGDRGLKIFSFSLDSLEAVEAMLAGPGPELVFTNNPGLFATRQRVHSGE
jgi:glycerophosphoryl diester phosphodiesterase